MSPPAFDGLDALGGIVESAVARDQAPPDAKRPLHRELPPAPPFPVEALGPLRPAAEAIVDCTQAPTAICAQSVLAGATLAVQAHRDVELPHPIGRRPLTGIFVSVAGSGDRKSAADRLAVKPVYAYEEEQRRVDKEARAEHRNALEAWQSAREKAKKAAKGDFAAAKHTLDALGPEPKAPPHPMLLVADPTPEALVLHLAEGRPWGGVFTAEGGLLVGGHAFNDETRMRMGALLNVLWDGDPIRRKRVGTGSQYLPGRRCSMHVMMQPNVAAKLFGDRTLGGIGTLARTLVVAPESTSGTRMWHEPSPASAPALAAYNARIGAFLTHPPRTAGDESDVLDPLPLTLHPEARPLWIRFHDAVEGALGVEGALAPVREFAAKMPEHAARLAAVLAAYADPDGMEVGTEAMVNGIILAQHYADELMRLQGAAALDPNLALAARLLAWWQARPDPRLYLSQIYQRGLNAIGDAKTARGIVSILQEHGWVRQLPASTVLDGAKRAEAWELVP